MRNRVRAGLSMLGISWGIVSVVMLLAYGEGFNQALLRGFQGAFGDGVTIMFPGQTSMQAGGERAGKRIRMRLADAEAVRRASAASRRGAPSTCSDAAVSWGTKQASYLVRARRARLRRSCGTSRRRSGASSTPRTCACSGGWSSSAARWRCKLFGNAPAVGQTIRIKGMPFEVIGVQKEKVQLSNYGRPDKESVFIPYTTAGAAVEHRVRQRARLSGDGSDARRAGHRRR